MISRVLVAADHDREITTTVQLGHPARAIVNRAEDYASSCSAATAVRSWIGSSSGTSPRRFSGGRRSP